MSDEVTFNVYFIFRFVFKSTNYEYAMQKKMNWIRLNAKIFFSIILRIKLLSVIIFWFSRIYSFIQNQKKIIRICLLFGTYLFDACINSVSTQCCILIHRVRVMLPLCICAVHWNELCVFLAQLVFLLISLLLVILRFRSFGWISQCSRYSCSSYRRHKACNDAHCV